MPRSILEPWEAGSLLGRVPNVAFEELVLGGDLNKSSSLQAVSWKGQQYALKRAKSSHSFVWELQRYLDLRHVQGCLIPRLFFLSRCPVTQDFYLGLELGKPVSEKERKLHEKIERLRSRLCVLGWTSPESDFFEAQNMVWITAGKQMKRTLVVTGLDAFIPYLADGKSYRPRPHYKIDERYGIVEVSPASIQVLDFNVSKSWNLRGEIRHGIFRNCHVSLIPIKTSTWLDRYAEMKAKWEDMLFPRVCGFARQHDGDLVLICSSLRNVSIFDDEMLDEFEPSFRYRLAKLGWQLPVHPFKAGLAWIAAGRGQVLLVTTKLDKLTKITENDKGNKSKQVTVRSTSNCKDMSISTAVAQTTGA